MEIRTLEVNVISAKDLNDITLFTKMDVYAVVSISGDSQQKKKTKVDRVNGKDPTWNFTAKFNVDVNSVRKTRATLDFLLRCDRVLGDQDIGEVHVPIGELLDSVGKPLQFVSYQVLKPSGKAKGVLNISYKFGELLTPPNVPAPEMKPPVGFGSVAAYPVGPGPAFSTATTLYPVVQNPPSATPTMDYGYPPPPQQTVAAGYMYPPQQLSNVCPSAPPFESYPPPQLAQYGGYPPPPKPNYGGYPPPSEPNYGGYPPPQYVGYPQQLQPNYGGYPPQPQPNYGGYPPLQQHEQGYNYPPSQPGYVYPHSDPGYGYPPSGQQGYGHPKKKKDNNNFGMGLGAGLLGGALGGMLIGDMVSDIDSYDPGLGGGGDF